MRKEFLVSGGSISLDKTSAILLEVSDVLSQSMPHQFAARLIREFGEPVDGLAHMLRQGNRPNIGEPWHKMIINHYEFILSGAHVLVKVPVKWLFFSGP
jgi:hypothetical protein